MHRHGRSRPDYPDLFLARDPVRALPAGRHHHPGGRGARRAAAEPVQHRPGAGGLRRPHPVDQNRRGAGLRGADPTAAADERPRAALPGDARRYRSECAVRHRRLYAERQTQPDACHPAVPPHPAAAERHPLNCRDAGTPAAADAKLRGDGRPAAGIRRQPAALQRHSVHRRRAAPPAVPGRTAAV